MHATLALGLLADTAAAGEKQNVLVLAGRDSQQPAYELFMSGFRAGVIARAVDRLELYTEFLDFTRFPQIEHSIRMKKYLREKYAATRIDLVISTSPMALDFVLQHRNALFPNVPVVYALVSTYELPAQRLPNDVIGIQDRFDPAKTLEMAKRLQPQARRVVVVTGADAFDKMWEDIARRELQVNDRGLEFNYLSGLPLGRLLEEVAHLPRDTIVLFLTVTRDGTGEIFKSPDVAQKVAADSGAPTYSVFPSYFGRGVVGGYMNSFEAVGEQTAAIALRLLSGERPEHMGAALGPEGSYVADARQLQRWSLDKSRLPAGSVVRFREPSVWVAYRWHIAAAALAIVLQSLLIAALILQRRQRRIAEVEVQHQRTELAHASRLATLGELSASIAHEVNQPLGAISSNADAVELLLDAEPPKLEDARRVLLDLKRANQRASDVVLRIRELLRKRELAFELYDLNAAAAEIVRLLDTDAMARGVQVLTEFESLPVVRGDRLQFQQVLLNLLVNGMDAMAGTPAGRRHLNVRTLHNEDGDVEIAVADTGGGIDAADMLRLFDSFFTTKKDGMGLGLALCRSIVQAHGGRIWAENSPGGGATFRFVLPVDAEQRVRKVSSRRRGIIDHEQSIAHRARSR